MRASHAVTVAVAAAFILTSIASAGADATKQRVQIDVRIPGKTFALATLQGGALKRDSGKLGDCTDETNGTALRNGQEVFLNECRAAALTGKRGTLVLQTKIAWAEAGGQYNVATGTWKVVEGTGQYAGVTGGGRIAQLGATKILIGRYQGYLVSG